MKLDQEVKLCEIIGKGFNECMRLHGYLPNTRITKDLEPTIQLVKEFIEVSYEPR